MGQDEREPPFFFAKPADAIVPDGGTVPYPSLHQGHAPRSRTGGGAEKRRAQHPGRQGASIASGATRVGIDLTRRDLQIASRSDASGRGKSARHSTTRRRAERCVPASKIGHPSQGQHRRSRCNGKVKQDGDLEQMIWNVPEMISKLSEMVALEPPATSS